MTCENHCRCDRILSPRSVARIQTGLNSCDKSQRQTKRKQVRKQLCRSVWKHLRQNLNQRMREHQSVSHHVKFELVYISSLPKSIACTEQGSYRSDLSQHQGRRGLVAAMCRIACLNLKRLGFSLARSFDVNSRSPQVIVLGRVVRKPVNANPGLKVNRGINFCCIKVLSIAYVL